MAENEIKSINGRNVCDQTARDAVNNITVPTKTSDLTNDNGFATETYVTSKIDDTTTATNKTWSSSKIDSQIKEIANTGNATLNKIEVLEEDPTDNLYEGRIWIYKQPDLSCTSITLDQTSVELTADNKTVTLVATVEPSNTTDNITWSSSKTSVATVNNGLVTAKANGSTIITVTCGSHSATCSITVSGFAEAETGVFTIEQSGVTSNIEFTAYNGATYDDVNKCYTFSGGSEYLTTPFTATDAITIDIVLQDNNNGNNTVILENDYSSDSKMFTMQSDTANNTSIVGMKYGQGNFASSLSAIYGDISDGNRHHMIFIFDSTTSKFTGYIDTIASKVVKTNITFTGISDITKWILGSRSGNYGTNANIYSLKLYDRALTTDECKTSLGDTGGGTEVTTPTPILSLSGSNFSNNEQTTTLPDNSGNGNNFTASGFSYTTSSGSNGNGGIVADGTDDKLTISTLNNMNGTNGYTIVMKCSINNLSQTSKYFVELDENPTGLVIHQLSVVYGFNSKGIQFYDGINIQNINIDITDTGIHTIAFSCDGTTLAGYLDGTQVGSIDITTNYLATDLIKGVIFNSTNTKSTSEHINATLYELRVYNRGMTSSEISNITTQLG